jgi:hypothetical protein
MFCVLLACGVAVAKKKEEYDPFRIPRDQFHSTVKTIALRDVGIPDGLSQPDAVKAGFESLITAELKKAGFEVVPAKEFDVLWKEGAESVGGLFDSTTGKPDEAKLKQLYESVGRTLKERFNADAVLWPQFKATSARFAGGRATWDGVHQTMTKGFWGAVAGGNTYGNIPAISLFVYIVDAEGKDLFVNVGGLQVAVKLGANSKFIDVPKDALFADPERNQGAVSQALDGLAQQPVKEK